MSTIARPSGQLPPGVYWRRRIVLIVIVALIIFGISRLFGGGGGDDDPSTSSPTVTATTAPPPRSSTTPTQSAPATKAPKQRSKREVVISVNLPAATGACDPSEVHVTPAVAPGTYASGTVPIHLAFSSTASRPCSLRIESPKLIVAVSSSDKTVWESKACGGITAQTIELQPTWSTTVDVLWNGRKTGKGCSSLGSFAAVGDYTLKAAMLGGEPASSTFALAQRPAPKPSATPSPTPSPKTTGPKKPDKSATPKQN